jgi:hypothetical protein
MNSSTPLPQRAACPLTLLRERKRCAHHSLRTEHTVVYGSRCFVRLDGLHRLRGIGVVQVQSLVTHLAAHDVSRLAA